MSQDDLEALDETLAILSYPELMERIREGKAAAEAGDRSSLDQLRTQLGL